MCRPPKTSEKSSHQYARQRLSEAPVETQNRYSLTIRRALTFLRQKLREGGKIYVIWADNSRKDIRGTMPFHLNQHKLVAHRPLSISNHRPRHLLVSRAIKWRIERKNV